MTVLMIEDNPDFAKLVHRWLVGDKANGEFVLEWRNTLAGGLERVQQGGIDVILLDLGLPDSAGFETLSRLVAHQSDVPVIVMSTADNETFALQMVQRGAQDYLVKSTCRAEMLVRILRYAVVRWAIQAGQSPPSEAKIVGVLGAKGGVGTTTFACTTALELHRQTKQKTLLVDLDLHGGLIGFLTNVQPNHTLLDALGFIEAFDESTWQQIVTQGPESIDILHSPCLLGGAQAPNPGDVRQLLAAVKPKYRWIVLDLGRLSAFSVELLGMVQELYVFSTSQLPSLYEARRVVGALRDRGCPIETIRLAVAQWNGTPSVDGKELDKLFGIPVEVHLQDASAEIRDACAAGKVPDEQGSFRSQIAILARKVAGMPEEAPKRKASRLFSFSQS